MQTYCGVDLQARQNLKEFVCVQSNNEDNKKFKAFYLTA
jgi:hypothetical protein